MAEREKIMKCTECTECPYYWKNEDDFFPHCQYEGQMDVPPCEYEEPEDYM